MDHIFVLETDANELNDLLKGVRSMIIHGSDSGCAPYGMIEEGETLFLAESSDPSLVKAVATVARVYNSGRLSETESFQMVIRNQDRLMLPDNVFYKWAGKHYLVLLSVNDVKAVDPFHLDKEPGIRDNFQLWPCGQGKSVIRSRLSA